jgi:ankyrin repeat protein
MLAGAWLVVNGSVRAADEARCRELDRKLELGIAELASVQMNALLFSAAEKGCGTTALRLLEAGASLEARDRLGAMPLAYAARAGHVPIVESFLQRGTPIDARNLAGSTALYLATENDRVRVVSLLLDKGADPAIPGRAGVTPLAAAAFRGNARLVDLLLSRGADPNTVDSTGKAPITYAAALGYTGIVSRLLAAGVDPNVPYGNDLTVLMWAAGHDDAAGVLDVAESVNLLLDRGARIDAADNRGRTALMIAAELGHSTAVDLLIRRGADRSLTDKAGKTALDLATNENLRAQLAVQ